MIKKRVTAKRTTANRKNAERSTGPRTENGKFHSKFNAVKYGLFANEVVIPDCDGEDASRNFAALLSDLQNELEPVGRLENVLVEKIAEALWRMKRAARAEAGATRMDGFWDRAPELPKDSIIDKLNRSVDLERLCLPILNQAREEIRLTGTLSSADYKKIQPLIDKRPKPPKDSPDQNTAVEPIVDDEFIRQLDKKIESLQYTVLRVDSRVAQRAEDFMKRGSLPSAEESEKIWRCRMRIEKEIDWAFKTLWSLQSMRKQISSRRNSKSKEHRSN